MKRPKMKDLCIPKGHKLYDKRFTNTWQAVLDDTKETSDDWQEEIKLLYENIELSEGHLVPQKYVNIAKGSEEDNYLDRLGI